ncbi:MAG TPA: hypothetical protein VNG34_02885 [Actinomycetota bacterium]|nr:hypothetical protein [Actinomycetota bacterium]
MQQHRAVRLVLVLLLATACTKADEPESSAASSPSPTTAGRPAVGNLVIEEPAWNTAGSNWVLRLAWDAPEGFDVDHYVVARNGIEVDDQVPGGRWTDGDVEPGARFSYRVTAMAADGTASRPAKGSIKTDTPSLDDARLEGSFVMTMHVNRATGTRDPVSGGAVVFRFDPTCGAGPCSVGWTVRDRQTEAMLPRRGGNYTAVVNTPLFITNCFGTVIDESVNVDLRVTAAAPVHGAWRATRVEGTVNERSSSSGCMSASIDWNVRGALQT